MIGREYYEGSGGWSDGRLGQVYDLISSVAQSLPDGSTEAGCLADALKAVELADTYIEKQERETRQTFPDVARGRPRPTTRDMGVHDLS